MLEYQKEFEMEVPFGTIRGKIWHHPDRTVDNCTERIIALHGWQDNCGTFDALLPLLSDDLYVVAIDFSGHGLSSHLPAGCSYNDTVFVIEIERIVQYLSWKDLQFSFLGHSMGAAIAMFYACLYPKSVKKLIALDMIKPLTFPSEMLAEKTREGIQQFLQLEAKTSINNCLAINDLSNVPLYDYNEAMSRLIASHSIFGKITEEGAKLLMKRGLKQSPNHLDKFYFTRDNRLKAILFLRMDFEALMHYFNELSCELLIIKAQNGLKLDSDEISDRYIELYRTKCPRFDIITVPGGHHVHLCDPGIVHDKINNFF
ncbi:putative serine hydrolase [Sarcoptes scabiei]|uniref:Putative serine hydrolase n=1 Tax=Sarcoptes scabiei TaxID=52283 RepID=A0A131ZUS6_SARSC|nr:putative serine hydrolase [Sarcoptes scabiei]KPM02494.1 serine hydrolase-like protein [Sarcoptes scabiei]